MRKPVLPHLHGLVSDFLSMFLAMRRGIAKMRDDPNTEAVVLEFALQQLHGNASRAAFHSKQKPSFMAAFAFTTA